MAEVQVSGCSATVSCLCGQQPDLPEGGAEEIQGAGEFLPLIKSVSYTPEIFYLILWCLLKINSLLFTHNNILCQESEQGKGQRQQVIKCILEVIIWQY